MTASGVPHVELAARYIEDVLSGTVPACKWVKAACQRQLDDLGRQATDEFPYVFDPMAAERVCRFVELMPHIKGRWARKRLKIELRPWQSFILTTVFGWVHSDTGTRRFRTVYEEVARKNAKTTKAATIGLYMLAADDEPGAEIWAAATTREQAGLVFKTARAMAKRSRGFRERFGVTVGAHAVSIEDSESTFQALSSDAHTLEGLSPHFASVDELHAHRTREVYDVLDDGLAAREQPLLWAVTTAGSNRAGICYERRTYGTKILNSVLHRHDGLGYRVEGDSIEDETVFVIIYTIDDDDDPFDESIWIKANPNLGVSVDIEDMRRRARAARAMAAARNSFLTKRLNIWVNADEAWMDMAALARCADSGLDEADFAGEECYAGLDLASRSDIAAFARLYRREVDGQYHYFYFGSYYLPEDTIEESPNSQYLGWYDSGWLIGTDGQRTDFRVIEDDVVELSETSRLRMLGVDPAQATEITNNLMDRGVEVVEVRPTVLNFSEPMKEFEALVKEGRFHFNGDPPFVWMVSNVVCHYDRKDNIYPAKTRQENKIDAVIAVIMALNLWVRQPSGSTIWDEDVTL